jgi:hypothetical protein
MGRSVAQSFGVGGEPIIRLCVSKNANDQIEEGFSGVFVGAGISVLV